MKSPKRIRCWLIHNYYGDVVTSSQSTCEYWKGIGRTATPGYFIPEKPKRKARRKP